ncbi:histidine kinase [Clostridium sp. CX1]|uniref:LytS/YhcK type 5TM receptor domain-containing protein n=1 Tax=Clostridium sp. CX1 TaxID=2978346 RepID=UPI0021C1EBFB|nr:LytS/YhcK type 5TM receptor domain-containing protein [Clostridium sp. CX1]MCT8976335.1 histidine kinase [Clostridium sp. CX1]
MIYIQMLERMALIALAAYIYNQSHIFKNLIKDELTVTDKVGMIVFFSLLGIIGTYTGIELEPYAIANTRPIGAIVAGYVGGPIVGVIVGAISGTHRYLLGGFTALACGIAAVVEGLTGALARKYSKDGAFSVRSAFIGGIVAECMQMLMLLIFARPLESAVKLVGFISLPMIIINSFGVLIFINIIQNARNDYNRIGAIQAQKALNIAKRTMGHIRKGLNKDTAEEVAKIIYEISDIKGVFIGDKTGLLAYYGEEVNEEALKENLYSYYKLPNYRVIKVNNHNRQALFVCTPFLVSGDKFEGLIGLRVKSEKNIDLYFWEFAKALSELLSTQLELYKLNKLAQEASTAKFKALRAQIEPHFLFNALNTIASFCRTSPTRARELIIDLSNYFRQTLKKQEDFVALKDELEFIQSYLSIEKARFGERLQLIVDIPEDMMNMIIPSFVLQPIIENSIKHGILPKPEGGSVYVKACYVKQDISISVEDTGVGMSEEKLKEVINEWPGIGLKNVNERLKLLYGERYEVKIVTALNKGTKVSFSLPKEDK